MEKEFINKPKNIARMDKIVFNMFVDNLSEEQVSMIRKWINALRSGEYKQGRKRLYTPSENSYCCLGVVCKECDFPELEKDFARAEYLDPSYMRLGLKSVSGIFQFVEEYTSDTSLVNLNDCGDYTFSEIADVIEAHLEDVLTRQHITNA